VADPRSRVRRELVGRLDFELDDFQRRALDAIDRNHSVLVAAPTSAGKTVVAEYAADLAIAEGGKAFYTTPIKALSNQKYGDFLRRLGPERVGLLTGDNAINGDAPLVVMTTEVLRNMIYAGSGSLDNLRYVILDEVHYLQDAYRGPVWEEVIIHAPATVRLVCLSATVSNTAELAEWISTVRGDTEAVVEDQRPVALNNLYMVGDKTAPTLHLLPTLVDGRPNSEAGRLDAESLRSPRLRSSRPRRRYYTPGRVDVIEHLAEADLLPAIYFIFSRAACNDAAQACVDAGLRLAGPDERQRIRDIVEARTASLSDADLDVLDYDRWLNTLELGMAAHHAGMVPPFKEAVEICFAEGLIRVVFATETLALGINMPARTVVIEKLSKFTGERHEFLTPGEYTQLTGRAGRRGIDPVGYAVVLWSPFVPFDQVAALAASRSFRLTSAFRPTYNMAVNLVHRYRAEQAHHLLNLSFAQYQADRSVVSIESRLDKRRSQLAEAEEAARCTRGDAAEFRRLVMARGEARRSASPKGEIAFALSQVRPGSILNIDSPRLHGRVAVLTYAQRRNDAKLRVITTKGKVLSLGVDDFHAAPEIVGEVELPVPFAPNNHNFQHRVARDLQRARVKRRRADRERESEVVRAEDAVRAHPVDRCPDRDAHVHALARAERLRREIDDLQRSVRGRTESLSRRFDRVLRVLEAWGHLDGWSVTDKGDRLRRLYHECDLLIAECLADGVLDDLDAPALAGLVSVFTYEHRSPETPPPPSFPSPALRRRFGRIVELGNELNADEQDAGLPLTRPPDPGFVVIASAWAAGDDLDHVIGDDEMSGGDFVRNIKQVVDLLRQIGDAAPGTATGRTADRGADALFRGVVAASAAVGEEGADELELAQAGRVEDQPTWGGHHLAAER
jgi:ATP-dependent RNA helicase HelY